MNFLLSDGNWALHRAWHAFGKTSSIPEKRVPNIILDWYCQAAIRWQCRAGALCFDGPKVFRHEVYAGYKESRKSESDELNTSDLVNALIKPTRELFEYHGIKTLQLPEYEADDLLVSGASKFTSKEFDKPQTNKVILLARDKDLHQAVTDRVCVYTPQMGVVPAQVWTPHAIKKKTGLTPKQFLNYQILIGDSTDCVPAIPKIGQPVAAKRIALNYPTLKEYFQCKEGQHAVKRYGKELMRNRKLITLSKSAWPNEIDDITFRPQGDNQYVKGLGALKAYLSKNSMFGA